MRLGRRFLAPNPNGDNALVAAGPDLYPNQFYDWLKKFFENGHLAFANGRKGRPPHDAQQAKIQKLEAKLQKKNEVMAELMEAHTELKKSLGEL